MTEPGSDIPPPQEPRSLRWKALGHWLHSVVFTVSVGIKALGHWLCSVVFAVSLVGIIVIIFGLALLFYWPQLRQAWRDMIPKPPTFGRIHVATPQVYTRERLVNDRFRQQAWLASQLERTDDLLKGGAFASIEGQIAVRDTRTLTFAVAQNAQEQDGTKPNEGASQNGKTGGKSERGTIHPPPTDEFRDALAYRDEIRAEMMRTQLDDRHDIEGNTLYRLNFDVTVTPGDNTRASALITIKVEENEDFHLKNYASLYADWHKHMQKEIDNAIAAQTADILSAGTLLDAPEKATLQEFFAWESCRTFSKILNAVWGKDGTNAALTCQPVDKITQAEISKYVASYMQVVRFRNNISLFKRLAEEKDNQKLRPEQMENLPQPLKALINNSTPLRAGDPLPPELDKGLAYVEQKCYETTDKKSFKKSFSEQLPNKSDTIDSLPCPYELRRHELLLGAITMLDRIHRINDILDKNKPKFTGLDAATQETLISQLSCLINPRNNPESTSDNSKDKAKKSLEGCGPLFAVLQKTDDPMLENILYGSLQPEPPAVRRVMAEFLKAKLNGELTSYRVVAPLRYFFDTDIGGCEIEECTLLLVAKINQEKFKAIIAPIIAPIAPLYYLVANTISPEKSKDISLLYDTTVLEYLKGVLNNGARTYSYAVTPTEMVQRLASEASTRANLQAALRTATVAGNKTFQTVLSGLHDLEREVAMHYRNPFVVGFGTPPTPAVDNKSPETLFGWIIRPRLMQQRQAGGEDYLQLARYYPLSAVISVPSWWKSLKITVSTQWVDDNVDDNVAVLRDYQGAHNIEVPGSVREIKEKLRYEVRQEPYIDLNATAEDGTRFLEIGRPARILLEGGRLWRSTVVTMGHQQADKIEVLPDMKGIIAEFKCVQPPPGIAGASAPPGNPSVPIAGASTPPGNPSVPIIVWTSEGRVRMPFIVDLRPYTQRDKDLVTRDNNAAKHDIPCYLEKNTPTP